MHRPPLSGTGEIMMTTAYPYHSTRVLAAHFGEIASRAAGWAVARRLANGSPSPPVLPADLRAAVVRAIARPASSCPPLVVRTGTGGDRLPRRSRSPAAPRAAPPRRSCPPVAVRPAI